MRQPTPGFRRWDIIKIPHPGRGGEVSYRPALVIVAGDILRHHGLLWVLMITSAPKHPGPGDIAFDDPQATGLVASVIRTAKIMTVQARAASVIGTLNGAQRTEVGEQVFANMGLRSP